MLALVAAVIFALALLLDLFNANLGDAFTPQTLLFAGLLCVALHLAGVGGASPVNGGWRGRGRKGRRCPRPTGPTRGFPGGDPCPDVRTPPRRDGGLRLPPV